MYTQSQRREFMNREVEEVEVEEEEEEEEEEKKKKKTTIITKKMLENRRTGATLRNGALSGSFVVCRLARQLAGVNRRNYIEEKLPRDNSD